LKNYLKYQVLKKNIYFDLKGENFESNESLLVFKLLDFLNKSNINSSKIWIGTLNIKQLEQLISLYNNKYKLGFITNNNLSSLDLISNFKKNLHFICIEYSSLNKNFIKKLKQENILVFTYTCTNFEVKTIMEKFDIDGICSDIEL